MSERVFRVFDTETTGLSHHYDQVIQFAGIAVDENLDYIQGDEILMDIRLRPDVLPSPFAFAVHGIDLNRLNRSPLNEFEAAALIQRWMMKTPNSVLTGFNSQSFDDEITRNMMYRSMLDPYEHEWKNQNSRMDLYRLILFVYALRPETLNWPVTEEGKVSLKLEKLCEANGIVLEHAHDARFDVIATIELMRTVKKNNPKIWDFFLTMTNKHEAKSLVETREPLLMVERFMPREHAHMSMVLPLIYDSSIQTKMLAIDLREDPTELLSLSADEIKRRSFTPVADLEDGEELRAIRNITTNKQPLICRPNVLKGREDVALRAGLDVKKCIQHAKMIAEAGNEFRMKIQEACTSSFPPCQDVYEGLYQLGFIDRDEHGLRSKTRKLSSTVVTRAGKEREVFIPDLHKLNMVELSGMKNRDRLRMFELGTRAKWANYGNFAIKDPAVDPIEMSAWVDHMDNTWNKEPFEEKSKRLNLTGFYQQLNEVRAQFALDDEREKVLDNLTKHVEKVHSHHQKVKAACARLIKKTSTPESDAEADKGKAESAEKEREADIEVLTNKKEDQSKVIEKSTVSSNKETRTEKEALEKPASNKMLEDFEKMLDSFTDRKTAEAVITNEALRRRKKEEESPSP